MLADVLDGGEGIIFRLEGDEPAADIAADLRVLGADGGRLKELLDILGCEGGGESAQNHRVSVQREVWLDQSLVSVQGDERGRSQQALQPFEFDGGTAKGSEKTGTGDQDLKRYVHIVFHLRDEIRVVGQVLATQQLFDFLDDLGVVGGIGELNVRESGGHCACRFSR